MAQAKIPENEKQYREALLGEVMIEQGRLEGLAKRRMKGNEGRERRGIIINDHQEPTITGEIF
jgi:hypothetical protein